ncbi:hypothetical protein ES705_45285 [subsurface metagenome]
MRNASQARYDKKSKMCRIYLADYLAIKAVSQGAGITMAEALHKLVVGKLKPEPEPEPVIAARSMPVIAARSTPVIAARSTPVIAVRSTPVIAVNGNNAGVIVIKPRGGKIYV